MTVRSSSTIKASAMARRPRSVYSGGDEPDPRFTLANERTFLAWIRTTLAILACSAAVEAVALPLSPRLRSSLAVVLAITALVSAAQAYRGWARTERALRHGRPLPGAPVNIVIVVGTLCACLTLLAAVFANATR